MINSKELVSYTKNLTILLVEDHHELRESTVNILSKLFKKVLSAKDGKEALNIYKDYYSEYNSYIDIVLSDLKMPMLDGVELTQAIYTINPQQSVIIISAFDEANYLLPLLNLGIAQFIKKPIDYQELLKVLLIVSKKITKPLESIQFDSSTFFTKDTNMLLVDNKTIYLTKYELIFLQLLTNHIEKIYSNEDIVLHYTANNETIDSQNIRKLVSKLRKKLPTDSIESIYGIGYRITLYTKD